jgi:hypothetical protein
VHRNLIVTDSTFMHIFRQKAFRYYKGLRKTFFYKFSYRVLLQNYNTHLQTLLIISTVFRNLGVLCLYSCKCRRKDCRSSFWNSWFCFSLAELIRFKTNSGDSVLWWNDEPSGFETTEKVDRANNNHLLKTKKIFINVMSFE